MIQRYTVQGYLSRACMDVVKAKEGVCHCGLYVYFGLLDEAVKAAVKPNHVPATVRLCQLRHVDSAGVEANSVPVCE